MREIDSKYHIEGDEIVNTRTGEVIPRDEPLVLFRAQDKLVGEMLWFYKDSALIAGCGGAHRQGIQRLLAKFAMWATAHPDRMKLPD